MKKLHKLICFILIFIIISNIKPVIPAGIYEKPLPLIYERLSDSYKKGESALRIMSYNILSDSVIYGGSPVALREKEMLSLFKSISPDVLALQEVSKSWYDVLKNKSELTFITPYYYQITNSMTTLLYNNKRLSLIKAISRVYENGSNSRLRRIDCGVFKDKTTNLIFSVINTHLNISSEDNAIPINQARELISFCRETEDKYNCTVLITGDFNSTEASQPHSQICAAYDYISLYAQNAQDTSQKATYGKEKTLKSQRLDHIFYKGNCIIKSFNLLSFTELMYLSDHFPVFADVVLKE